MANGVLVICEHDAGVFKKTAAELLAKAASLGLGPVTALVVGDADGASLGGFGANKVLSVTGAAFARHDTTALVAAVQAAVAAVSPAYIFAAATPASRDVLPRLAARLGIGMASEVTGLRVDGGTLVGRRPTYAGKATADVRVSSVPAVFTVRPNSFGAPASNGGSAAVESLAVNPGNSLTQVVGHEASTSAIADLTVADRIVSGGRTVRSKEGYDSLVRPLAAAIGATPGASRACVDNGYAPHSHQVGQTGKVVNPSLYVAMGISGQIQHLAGMRTSKIIVAVNTDATAPIFSVATYGVVADMFEFAPLLQKELAAALAQ
jgi:electron transfer flavoprotein alpha subunit